MAVSISLECTLCSSPFSDPRLLPCLHVYCKCCLESLPLVSQNEAGTLTCPSCYKIAPDCTPSQLPKHLKIEREVSASKLKQSDEQLCGSCNDSNKATEAYCQECVFPLCSECVSIHKRLKLLKAHAIVSLESANTGAVTSFPCDTHPNEVLKYYCSSCQILACSDCMLDHSNHKCNRLEDVAQEGRAELASLLEEVKVFDPILSNDIGRLDLCLESLSDNTTSVAKEINDTFDKLFASMEKRRKELLNSLKETAVTKKTQLELQKKSLQSIALQLRSVMDSCTSAIADYVDAEALAVKASIQQAAKKGIEEMKSTDSRPVTSYALSFESKIFEDTILTLGTIYSHSEYAPLCSLVGVNQSLGLGVARGQESIVTLQTRDRKGEDITVGGADVKGRVIQLTSEKSFPIECTVTDCANGRYEIKCTCDIEGEYVLDIMIYGVSIYRESQQRIIVRDYTKMKGPERGCATQGSAYFLDFEFDNKVFVSAGNSIEVFSNELDALNEHLSGSSNFRGLAIDEKNGIMFVADYKKSTIIKATLDGTFIASYGPTIMSSATKFSCTLSKPMGLCLTKEGLLLIADSRNKKIRRVQTHDMSYITSIHCSDIVRGIAVDSAGNIHTAVTDRVEVFDGNVALTHKNMYGKGRLVKAVDIAFLKTQCHPNSYSFVSDHLGSKILMFDWMNNTVLRSVSITTPSGIAISQEGSIYVGAFNRKYFFIL